MVGIINMIIVKKMIDIHSHILPNIDDGAKDIEESIEMAKLYLENGIQKVIATPHYIEGYENSPKKDNIIILDRFREILRKEGLELEVYLGNEIYITMNIFIFLKEKRVATLNNSSYILLEFPMLNMPIFVEGLIYNLLLKGYVPIIAHPERNKKIIDNPNILYNLINKGALAQLNLPSLVGRYGHEIKTTGEILLKHNMIHFVSTDAHSKHKRSPKVSNSLNILKNLVDAKTFEEITFINPSKVIEDKEIFPNKPIEYNKKNGLLNFLKTKH